MAKKEEQVNTNIFESNEEDIQTAIKNAAVVNDEIVKAAAEDIAKRRKEKLTEELKDLVQKCEFTEKSISLSLRRSNRVNQRQKSYMKAIHDLAEDIKNGKKPVTAWDKESMELKKQYDKDIIEIGKDIDESKRELERIFPDSWRWRYGELIPNR